MYCLPKTVDIKAKMAIDTQHVPKMFEKYNLFEGKCFAP